MQTLTFYVSAANTLGVVRDYANAQTVTPPTFTRDVRACLKMRVFATDESPSPYPMADLAAISAWQFVMDDDFDSTSNYILVADHSDISVQSVTDTIDGTEKEFTEFTIPITNMNTQELNTLLNTKESAANLNGELVGFDSNGDAVFVLQIKNFTVRNRISSTGNPTELPAEYLTAGQVRAIIAAGIDLQFSADGTEWHDTQTDSDLFFRMRSASDASAAWSDPVELLRGPAGPQGDPGPTSTSYRTHVAFATDNTGAGFITDATEWTADHKFIAFLTTAESQTVTANDFAGMWIRLIPENSGTGSGSGNGSGVSQQYVDEKLSSKADLVDGKVPASQLPSYVDEVTEYATMYDFPVIGEAGKIFVAIDSGKVYRWAGTEYIEISQSDVSVVSTDDTGITLNIAGTQYVFSKVLTASQISTNTGTVQDAVDCIPQSINGVTVTNNTVTISASDIQTSDGYSIQQEITNLKTAPAIKTINQQNPDDNGDFNLTASLVTLETTFGGYSMNVNDAFATIDRYFVKSVNNVGVDGNNNVTLTAENISTANANGSIQFHLDNHETRISALEEGGENSGGGSDGGVSSVNNVQPDGSGNIYIDGSHITAVNGDSIDNHIMNINNQATGLINRVDALEQGGGNVKTVAGVSPDEYGNVPLTAENIGTVDTDFPNLQAEVCYIYEQALPQMIKQINGVTADSSGSVEIFAQYIPTSTGSSVEDELNNLKQAPAVMSVCGVTPNGNGDVTLWADNIGVQSGGSLQSALDSCVKNISGFTPDGSGYIELIANPIRFDMGDRQTVLETIINELEERIAALESRNNG